jgi:large subunit ribosomal protein L4
VTAVPVKNLRGEVVGSMELDERVFGIEPNRAVLHQAVVAQLANRRAGTHDTKTRAEVAGGTHKLYRQKGTGRARQGDRRAPHWAGGGIVFGPHPRSYQQAMPKKMRRLAMRSALSARLAEDALTVVDEVSAPAAKTREMAELLRTLGIERGALIVMPDRDANMARAASNLRNVRAVTPGGLNLLDVLNFRHVLMTRAAAEAVTELVLHGAGPGARRGASGIDTGSEEVTGEPSVEQSEKDEPSVEMSEQAVRSRKPKDVAHAEAAERVAEPEAEAS